MATINPNQDYDIIHTLTLNSASGTADIRLYRGDYPAFSGTIYYRAGTSGSWTSLSVSGTDTTFPVSSTIMQIAHDWNKSGDDYMTPSFSLNSSITGITISQKAPLSGSVGDYFMTYYAESCHSLTSLEVPDTSSLTSVGDYFMASYAENCPSLTSLGVPDTSNLTSVGDYFMSGYAYICTSLEVLELPSVGWFESNNASWDVPSNRLGILRGNTKNETDQSDWQALTVSGKTLHTNHIRSNYDVLLNGVPPNYPPATTPNSPAASSTVSGVRPTLDFTGNDFETDTITYQLQLHTSDTWTSPLLDVASASNAGFTNRSDVKTDPFYSGNQIRYTLQSDLQRGQEYFWRVRGKDVGGSNEWGDWTTSRKFTVSAIPPTVTITGVAEILDTSISINGSITSNGGATVTEHGVVLSTSPNPTTSDLKFTATGDNFTAVATGLTASTTYYVRAYAINSAGTSYSVESTIMTLQPQTPPTVEVGDPTRLIDVSTQLTATVTLDGTSEVTERGIVFGTEPNPDTDDNKVTATSAGLGEYTLLLTGLLPETTYHYRAYAINEYGTGYSTDKAFTTLPSFVPDEGDGYWVFSVTESDAIISRSQATPAHSSASLPLADLGLEDGKTYTLAVGDFVSELGDPKVSLLSYGYTDPTPILAESGEYLLTETDENILLEQLEPINSIDIPENSQLTFTYSLTNYHSYILQLHVTGDDPVTEELTATFKDLYLAEESTFSDFVPFTPYGLFEIKLENNQIVDKRRQDVIQSMFDKVQGWNVTPFDITTEGLGYFEIGDGITIKDPQDNEVKSYITEYTLTLDGGISEKLIGIRPPETETDYSKAGNIKKLISNTTLQVDKQRQEIEALVQDVYDNDGYIEEKFSQVFQDINQVRTTVQGAGGVNLIRNSVMYAYNNLGYPENWTTTHVDGEGTTIVIQGSAESKAAGGLSGNTFTLNGVKVVQNVTVRKDADFITEENKTYYTFNIKVKKNLVGEAYIKLSNREEEHTIDLPNGEAYLWEDFKIEGLLPQDDHYEIELYSDQDAEAQFTDAMLSVGEYTHSWTQAAGEIGNASVSITETGVTVRQDQFRYNYTHLDALGLNVHKRIRGQQEEVFGFNADETHMSKIKADKQVSMGKVRVVPIEMGGTSGWAWTGAEE